MSNMPPEEKSNAAPAIGSSDGTIPPSTDIKGFKLSSIKWDKSESHMDDSLASCLEIISELLGKPISSVAFKAGLPLENNKLTPSHFIRAAKNAGLTSRIVHKKLDNISKL